MTSPLSFASSRRTFPRGVHPAGEKQLAADAPIEVLPTPKGVRIALHQHVGAPGVAIVKTKTEVEIGDPLSEAKGPVSAPVHASIKGVVGRAGNVTLPNGRHVEFLPIRAAEAQTLEGRALYEDQFGGEWPLDCVEAYAPEQITAASRAAGLVGLGGAAFPLHVKLTRNEKKPIHTVIINACECEPYIDSDYRLMLEAPAPVILGALLARRAAGAERVVIGVEDNKPAAIEALRRAAGASGVEIAVLKTKYPQGGEKQLIHALTGREVPSGGLPLDIGFVVVNVATTAALARAVLRGKPLTHRVVCVTGRGIAQPKNLLVPLGVAVSELIDYCGGLTPNAARVIAGGPMMGFAIGNLDTPVTKGTSAITVLTAEEVRKSAETACVRCGRCVDVCPMRLTPTKIAHAARAGNPELAERYFINDCMECGCCAYICPASLPLVQLIRIGKIQVRKAREAKKN